jgi:hypothetical protein
MTTRARAGSHQSVPTSTARALRRVVNFVVAAGFAVALAVPAHAAPNLVTNGGFETGDFTGWTGTGDTSFDGVQCPGPGPLVYEGNCSAFFGPFGGLGGISQTLNSLIVGALYQITFALDPDGGTPSFFSASFGGTNLISLTDLAPGPYRVYSFAAQATAASQTLAFNFRNDPGFLNLDAVRVSIPEPASIALLGTGLIGLLLRRRRESL